MAVADKLKPAIAPTWNVNGTNGSLTADTSAGYTVSGNKIIYSAKKTGSAQVVLNGLTKNAKLTAPSNKVITIAATALGKNTSLKSNSGNYSLKLTGDMKGKTFTGTAKADTINIAASNAAIIGGGGNDKLTFSGSKVTVTGGKGNDVFVYEKGDNVIADFTAGDKVSIGAAISKTSLSGSNAIFTIGKNTLTVTKGKDKEITFITAKNKEQTVIGGALLADNSTNAKVTLEKWRTTADASSRTKTIQITGNAGNDSILGGDGADTLSGGTGDDKIYGGDGKDALRGGKGNDSLWGGNGADSFIYASGDGNDVIYGFDNTDMLQITGTFSGTYNKSQKAVSFKVGSTSNAITLKDFGTTSTFNVNGINYKISGSSLKKK